MHNNMFHVHDVPKDDHMSLKRTTRHICGPFKMQPHFSAVFWTTQKTCSTQTGVPGLLGHWPVIVQSFYMYLPSQKQSDTQRLDIGIKKSNIAAINIF